MEHMDKRILSSVIDSAMHRIPADLVIRNCNVVDVYTGTVRKDNIAIHYGRIVGFGEDYVGKEEIDAKVITKAGVKDIHLFFQNLTADERQILADGCLMNYYKNKK